ncbi:olfactory receptor 5AP2-like [Carettochelys insculpta]|uniref:olfactory receptor 5AP2-like n=1 Tax=Carettochelys insculpta TaxID=44489 RepID=UPI003EBAC257
MEKADGRNQTPITEFILLGFGDVSELQPLLSLLFLVIFFVTMVGNILIIVLVVTDRHLHNPMYFFLGNLSGLDICYSITILHRVLASLLTGDRSVSVKCCLVQTYFFAIIATTENLLLAAMSYDRYLAICHPLRYAALMNTRVCFELVAGSWLYSFLVNGTLNSFLFRLTFCHSKEIDHYFCDFTPTIKLVCGDTRSLELATFAVSTVGTVVPLLFTLVSYICIITTILKIPSTTGRQKAFSTCSAHLMVVTILYATVITIYVFPTSNTSKVQHKIFSLLYTVVIPMINPVIYSLRNKDVNESLKKALPKMIAVRNKQRNIKEKF